MVLTVCVESFYLTFVIIFALKNIFDMFALRYSNDRLRKHIMMNLMFDIIIILSLVLWMMLTSKVCT